MISISMRCYSSTSAGFDLTSSSNFAAFDSRLGLRNRCLMTYMISSYSPTSSDENSIHLPRKPGLISIPFRKYKRLFSTLQKTASKN